MKIALLGKGKTGGKVLEIKNDHDVTVFDSKNKPTVETLRNNDVIISFLPGEALIELLPILFESGLPMATGSTGMEWPDGINEELVSRNMTWVSASNFSIGMNLVHSMIDVLSQTPSLFDDFSFKLKEIHHTDKQDAPSGTALTWGEWLGQKVEFESERTGDVIGDHKLTLDTPFEEISLQHVAKDRKIFARGAVWTAEKLVAGVGLKGLVSLSDIMKEELSK